MKTPKLTTARRAVERLRLEASEASEMDLRIWEAGHLVADLETADDESAVATARRASLVMDAVLAVVAVLAMGFSLGNIHRFALGHEVTDPIAWFLAPAIDLALCAALLGDAVLSRYELDAGPWATKLRWYAAAATLALNTWSAWASLDAASIVLHSALPILLFLLAEAASPYRERFAETVRLAAEAITRPDRTPAPTTAQSAVQPPSVASHGEEEKAQATPRTPHPLTLAPSIEKPARPAVVRAARTQASVTARAAYERPADLAAERTDARRQYARSVKDGTALTAGALGRLYGKSESWGRKQIEAVKAEQIPGQTGIEAAGGAQ